MRSEPATPPTSRRGRHRSAPRWTAEASTTGVTVALPSGEARLILPLATIARAVEPRVPWPVSADWHRSPEAASMLAGGAAKLLAFTAALSCTGDRSGPAAPGAGDRWRLSAPARRRSAKRGAAGSHVPRVARSALSSIAVACTLSENPRHRVPPFPPGRLLALRNRVRSCGYRSGVVQCSPARGRGRVVNARARG